MKKSERTKDSPEKGGRFSLSQMIRAYLLAIRIIHRDLGIVRIIAAYVFFVFALFSLLFTIKLPVAGDFMTPTEGAKASSRAISLFLMLINLLVYGMILNWRRGHVIPMAVRIALIGVVFYLDTFLIRIVYILIHTGALF